jgi:RHS repeat-associated protein
VRARAVPTGQPNPGVAWYLTDKQGSVTDLMDGTQALRDHLDYSGYGAVTESNPSFGDSYKYDGGQYDANTGLVRFGARWYDPATGRWLSEDPSGLAPDSNPYRYVENDATNAVDPTGLEPTAPPKKWDEPPADQKVRGGNWKIAELKSSGDVVWMHNPDGTLNGYIFLKGPGTVTHCGHCFWFDGFNSFLWSYDTQGRVTHALFFNVEPSNVGDKNNFEAKIQELDKPVGEAFSKFPMEGTDKEKQAAWGEIGKAQEKEMSQLKDYFRDNAKLFIESDGSGKMVIGKANRDLVPDKGYYNALMYEWTRKDNKVVVYRLKAPEKAEGKANWVEYKKIKGNGERP